MLIECERCSGKQCITCAEMEKVEYDLMMKRKESICFVRVASNMYYQPFKWIGKVKVSVQNIWKL